MTGPTSAGLRTRSVRHPPGLLAGTSSCAGCRGSASAVPHAPTLARRTRDALLSNRIAPAPHGAMVPGSDLCSGGCSAPCCAPPRRGPVEEVRAGPAPLMTQWIPDRSPITMPSSGQRTRRIRVDPFRCSVRCTRSRSDGRSHPEVLTPCCPVACVVGPKGPAPGAAAPRIDHYRGSRPVDGTGRSCCLMKISDGSDLEWLRSLVTQRDVEALGNAGVLRVCDGVAVTPTVIPS